VPFRPGSPPDPGGNDGHLLVPALERVGDRDLHRRSPPGSCATELGFTGTFVTDALEMRAVSATIASPRGSRSLAAGADAIEDRGQAGAPDRADRRGRGQRRPRRAADLPVWKTLPATAALATRAIRPRSLMHRTRPPLPRDPRDAADAAPPTRYRMPAPTAWRPGAALVAGRGDPRRSPGYRTLTSTAGEPHPAATARWSSWFVTPPPSVAARRARCGGNAVG